MDLQPGQNFSITQHSPAAPMVEIVLDWQPAQTPLMLDSSAFALNAGERYAVTAISSSTTRRH